MAADAPIGTRFDGSANTRFSVGGDPLHVVNGFQGLFAVIGLIERYEPLIDGAEDDRGFGTPAVRVAVQILLLGQQGALGGQKLEHADVGGGWFLGLQVLDGFQRSQADEFGRHLAIVDVATVVAHRTIDVQVIVESGDIIVGAMTGRCVHTAGATLGGDVFGEHDGGGAIGEGVTGGEVFELRAWNGFGDRGRLFAFDIREHGAQQRLGDDDVVFAQVSDRVVDARVERDRHVGWDRPGSGGPDDEVDRFVGREAKFLGLVSRHREFNPNRERRVVAVFDFGLGEGGFEGDGPVNRLLTAENDALLDEGGEGADDVRFVSGVLGLILIGPVGLHPEALELAGLSFDPALGKGIAAGAAFGGRDLFAGILDLTGHLLLDGQAMAVPARDVGRTEAAHGLIVAHRILEDLVERGADMDVPIGEGRAIMQHVGRGLGPKPLHGGVEVELVPMGEAARFPFNEICPHGEFCLREQKRVFKVLRHPEIKGADATAAWGRVKGRNWVF